MTELDTSLLADAVAYADRWIGYQQRLKEIPAVAVAVRHGDDLILSSAHGYANLERREPVTTDHIFRVASHSKWFTSTAIMQLVEQGRLRLDDRLDAYIPWLDGPIARTTIRQVLNHAAGITRDGYDNDHWQLEHPFPDPDQLRCLVEQDGHVLPANDRLKYSNIGFSLLGMVVEAVTGEPYNDHVRHAIVDRLDLQSTGPETEPAIRPRLVTGYTARELLFPRTPLPDVETGAMSAATGFFSTAEDLTRFAAAHFLGNDELLSDESKREMQRPYWSVEGMPSYGLGMQITKIGDRRVVGHSGGFPGHSTWTALDARDRLAVSVLTSDSAGPAAVLGAGVFKLIDLALKQKPAADPAQLDRFTGRFLDLESVLDVVRLGDQLFAVFPTADDPCAVTYKLEVVDGDTLRLENREGYGFPGELVRYFRDADARIDRVVVAGSTHYPEDRFKQRFDARLAALESVV